MYLLAICLLCYLNTLDSLKTQNRPNLIELLTAYEVKRGDVTLNNFLTELETRYSIARDTISKVGSRVASNYAEDVTNEAKLVQTLIIKQLMGIEEAVAADIVFYNEPLSKLEDTVQIFSLSSNTFDFCRNSNIRSELMQGKKFTQSNIEQILSMNQNNDVTRKEDLDVNELINLNSDDRGDRKVLRRGNVLPSLQRLQKEASVPRALKVPSNVDNVLNLVEQRKQERVKKAVEDKQLKEFEKVKLGIKEELRQLTKNFVDERNSSLLSAVTTGVDQVNNYAKRVINNILIDNIALHLINGTSGNNTMMISNLSFDKIESTMKFSFNRTFRGIEKTFVDPVVESIFGIDAEMRIQRHMNVSSAARRADVFRSIQSVMNSENSSAAPNFPLLLHSCLLSSMAAYNLDLDVPQEFKEFVDKITGELWNIEDESWGDTSLDLDKCRAASMAAMGLGKDCFKGNDGMNDYNDNAISATTTTAAAAAIPENTDIRVISIRSSTACAILSIDYSQNLASLAFRGTRDPIDVITDLRISSADFEPRRNVERGLQLGKMEVHQGFLSAFESISVEINEILDTLHEDMRLIITGHSMGGGLAQIAAAYYSHMSPVLVTFGSPSVGNSEFCAFLNRQVSPAGGIRVFNEYDPVAYLAQIVGYSHAGTPICLKQRESAKDIFANENINAFVAPATLYAVTPHILYQIGGLVHTFPVLGHDDYDEEQNRN